MRMEIQSVRVRTNTGKDPVYGGSGVSVSNDYWTGIRVESTAKYVGKHNKICYAGYYYNYPNTAVRVTGEVNLFAIFGDSEFNWNGNVNTD